jgi:hypothetical protein
LCPACRSPVRSPLPPARSSVSAHGTAGRCGAGVPARPVMVQPHAQPPAPRPPLSDSAAAQPRPPASEPAAAAGADQFAHGSDEAARWQ